MKRDITIRFTIPRALRKRWTVAASVAVLCAGALVYANVPNAFNSGDKLSAQKLNDNFNALVDLTSNQTIAGTKSWTAGGIFSGKNATPYLLAEGGTEYTDSVVTVDQSSVGGYAGVLIKGNTTNLNYGNIGFSLENSNGHTILLAGIEGHIGSVTAGSETGDLTFSTKPSTDNIREVMRLTGAGNVGIGTTSPSYTLDVNGTIRGTNVSPSDARLKTNVRTIDHALDDVARLRGVRFTWKKDGKHSVGVIAQEVEAVYPELVSTDGEGIKAVEYGKLVGVLIEATKELRADNARLAARMDRLESQRAMHARNDHSSSAE